MVDNPYWHDEYKPHLTDRNEIRSLCFGINNIFQASSNLQSTEEFDEAPYEFELSELDKITYELSEREISIKILRLALLIRIFDDTYSHFQENSEFTDYMNNINTKHTPILRINKGNERWENSIRECCNKIIHADDFRPVYSTESDRNNPNATWGMEGTIELEGRLGKNIWQVSFDLLQFLETCLDLIKYGEE